MAAQQQQQQQPNSSDEIGLVKFTRQISKRLMEEETPQQQQDPCCRLDEFVRDNFQRLECCRFVPRDDNADICGCNRSRSEHKPEALQQQQQQQQQWSSETCCSRLPTNAHGEIKFADFGKTRTAHRPKFVRLQASGYSAEAVWRLLTDQDKWALPLPDFVLSVSGGAGDRRRFSKKFADKLKKAVLQVVRNMRSVWVITHGLGVGVSAEFGRLLRDSSFTKSGEGNVALIGINTWGIVNNAEMLQDDEQLSKGWKLSGERLRRYVYTMGDLSPGLRRLNKDHTHFVLADDGSRGSGGREIPLRTELEEFVVSRVRDLRRRRSGDAAAVPPVVQLCVEGGRFTLAAAAEAARRGTPVVTVRGSGRCADLLAWACDLQQQQQQVEEEEVAEKVAEFEDIGDEAERRRLEESLLSFVSGPAAGRLSVFDPDAEDADLSRAILFGVFRHKDFRDNRTMQARVAMALGRADIAEAEIFASTSERELQLLGMRSLFVEALLEQRADFVKLFVEYGVSVSSVLTEDVLKQLYLRFVTQHGQQSEQLLGYIVNPKTMATSCAVCLCGGDKKDIEDHLLHLVGESLRMLTDDMMSNIYCEGLMQQQQHQQNGSQLTYPPRKENGERKYTHQDLFIWAILCHNVQLALLFWKDGKDHVSTALVGRLLLRRMAADAKARDEINMMAAFEADAQRFEQLAVDVLTRCYARSRDFARALLIRELPMWNCHTALSIAECSECLEFMHHTSVQEVLRMVWMGGMVPSTPTWKIVACLLLPPLVPSVLFKTHRRQGHDSLHRWRARQWPGHRQQENNPQLQEALMQAEAVDPLAPNTREYLESLMMADAASGLRSKKQLRTEELYRKQRGFMSLTFFQCLRLFFTAPIVKFSLNFISTIFFLLVLAHVVLVELRPRCSAGGWHWTEWYAGAWVLQYAVEEVRQFTHFRSLRSKLAGLSHWDKFDAILCCLMLVCCCLRIGLSASTCDWARCLYALTFALLVLRFMQFYCAHSELGPKVQMVIQMFYGDLAFFVCILALFIVAFGVASLSLLDTSLRLEPKLLKDVVYSPYWQMYGDLGLDGMVDGTGSSLRQFFAVAMLAVYMLGTNVLLLNLLIAMFNNTFNVMEPNSHKYWSHIRYNLIYEYYYRPCLPPPFAIVIHIWRLGAYAYRRLVRSCCGRQHIRSDDFVMRLKLSHHQRLQAFEAQAADTCLQEAQTD